MLSRKGVAPVVLRQWLALALSKAYRLTEGNLRGAPIPGSARARRTVAQKRVEELGIIGAGHLPVNEVRQNPGSEDMVNS